MAAPGQLSRSSLKLSDLPTEVQKSIIQYVPRKHLFKIQKISRQLFSLASAELYSDLHFRLTTTGAKDDDTPATRLSDALNTFATSDHDYAQYIKSFRLSISQEDTFNALTLARLFWPTGSDPTKILSTAMLLMLRKANIMETFQWDVPIELTGPVYQALHGIHSLRNLRIKAAGIPIRLAIQPTYSTTPGYAAQAPGGPLPQGQATLSAVPATTSTTSSMAKRLSKKPKGRLDDGTAGGAFSGFTKLASVAFTDLTSLDCVTDIAECIKASSTTLRSLSLSLSWELAQKSRKSTTTAPPANDLDDGDFSDDTEDMLNADLPPPPVTQPVSAADARRDKLAQDAILSKIFDMQWAAAEGKKIEKDLSLSTDDLHNSSNCEIQDSDFSLLSDLAKSLTAVMIAKGRGKKEDIQRAIELMSRATKELGRSVGGTGIVGTVDGLSILSNGQLGGSAASAASGSGTAAAVVPQPVATGSTSAPSMPASNSNISGWDLHNPVEADVALAKYGELQSLGGLSAAQAHKTVMQMLAPTSGAGSNILAEAEPASHEESPPSFTNSQEAGGQHSSSIVDQQILSTEGEDDDMDLDMDHPDESTVDVGPDQELVDEIEEPEIGPRKRAKFEKTLTTQSTERPSEVSLASDSLSSKMPEETSKTGGVEVSSDNTMQKYIRATHGLQLQEFSLYLIPLRASIVARALDLSVLKRITLLEVGSQVAFWQLLQRLSKSVPDLGFHMIHTDDVSMAFLNFLSTSDGVRELYLHKKKKKEPEPETTAPKVDIKAICKLGLRKHFDTITHLMLKNDIDETWDLDHWIVRTFSLRGSGLVELAVSMKLQTLHTLVQNITSFASLRTLHFLHLRTSSSASGSIFEIDPVSFLTDTLIHFPDRKIKYLGVSERFATVDSPADIARRVKLVADKRVLMEKKKKAAKGKGKEIVPNVSKLQDKGLDDFIWIAEDDSWDEGGVEHIAMRVKECGVKWHTKFWEVEDCKVFEQGIRLGKLSWGA